LNVSTSIQAKSDRTLFLVITPGLVQAAREARDAFHAVELARAGLKAALSVTVTFTRRSAAHKSEGVLRTLTQQGNTCIRPDVNVLSPDGLTLHCLLEVYGLLDPRCIDLIQQIVGANAGGFLRVPRSHKRWIGQQLNFLDPLSIASVVIKSSEGGELEPKQADELRHLAMRNRDAAVRCLNMILGACQKNRPREQTTYDGPVHQITITEEGDIQGDFAQPLNESRKAALYILAQLDFALVSTLDFAMRYTRRLEPDEVSDSNHNNTFNQAMAGLKKSLPHLRWEVTERRNHRRVLGLAIDNRASDDVLEERCHWLRFDGPGSDINCAPTTMKDLARLLKGQITTS
jgi:hypothetical protein